ncbi:DUF4160 domain-containing protein [Pontibacter mangrovi]|nr:DUF4160 domain-containing protein [Pontibacter mangrovi]
MVRASYSGVVQQALELDRIAGTLPNRAHALVLEWASLHKEELLAK